MSFSFPTNGRWHVIQAKVEETEIVEGIDADGGRRQKAFDRIPT
jgi:hypothetical protein